MQLRVEVECFDKGLSEKLYGRMRLKAFLFGTGERKIIGAEGWWVRANQQDNVLITNIIFWYSATCLPKAPVYLLQAPGLLPRCCGHRLPALGSHNEVFVSGPPKCFQVNKIYE